MARKNRVFRSYVRASLGTAAVMLLLFLWVRTSPPPMSTVPGSTSRPAEELETTSAQAESQITGKVVRVIDGDTIELQVGAAEMIRIRLNGIDAPERGQPFGNNATDALKESIGGQFVTVESHGEDKYGRTIGDIYHNGELINRALVRAGLAWHYLKYAADRTDLADAERAARELGGGLWSGSHTPVPPWDWRGMSKEERDRRR